MEEEDVNSSQSISDIIPEIKKRKGESLDNVRGKKERSNRGKVNAIFIYLKPYFYTFAAECAQCTRDQGTKDCKGLFSPLKIMFKLIC